MKRKIWRKNFSVSRVALHMMAPAIQDLMPYQRLTVGRQLLRELFFVQHGFEVSGAYVPVNQLRDLVAATLRALQQNPEKVSHIHRRTVGYNTEYFRYARKLASVDFSHASTIKLIQYYQRLNYFQEISHGYAIATTWFVDSDSEDFSKLLLQRTRSILQKVGDERNPAEVFSLLTTPTRPSMALREELASFRILQKIEANLAARRLFRNGDAGTIARGLKRLPQILRRSIYRHWRKWRWVPFTYLGPAYGLDFYLTTWSNLLREDVTTTRHLANLREQLPRVRIAQRRLLRTLKVGPADRRLYALAAEIIWLKAYRKDALFHGMYVLERLHTEIARRLHLTVNQVRFLIDDEIVRALKSGRCPPAVPNARMKFCVYYQFGRQYRVHVGMSARRFLARQKIEREPRTRSGRLEGTCACPGRARGTVRVVNQPEQMGKMRRGDIMVAHTTFPALVPAMKKASAILTDDGGITCHAAIVARELQIPCVVGTKIATQVLKDGDEVEVDAYKGIVRKL